MKPTVEQIAASISLVHMARRQAWPQADFMDAPVPGATLLAWAATWEKMRMSWIETVEDLVEKIPLIDDAQMMQILVHNLIADLESSAQAQRLEMMAVLDG